MEKNWLYQMTRAFVFIVMRLYFRIEYIGTENLKSIGSMVVAPNHVSYLDPFWISVPFKRPLRYMTWDKMTRLPVLGRLMRAYGAFPVNIEHSVGDRNALRASLEQLHDGGKLMIFPEGGRTRDGELLSFKPGFIRLALEANVPVMPVSIVGGYRAFGPHLKFPKPYKIKVIFHKPITLDSPPDLHDKKLLKDYMQIQCDKVRSMIAQDLSEY